MPDTVAATVPPAAGPAPDPAKPDGSRWAGRPAALWGGLASAVLVLQFAARWAEASAGDGLRDLVSGLNQFDGPEYIHIATEGYRQRQLVWFPLYPMAMRAVDLVLRDALVSGVLISLVAGGVAAWAYWRWLAIQRVPTAARTTAYLLLLVYPYAWYLYGVIYADALFLALCLGAFLLFEADHRVLSAVAAALATATRPSGFAVVIGLFVLALERRGALATTGTGPRWVTALHLPTSLRLRLVRGSDLWPLAGLAGLGGYMAWSWAAWGAPLRFMTEQENYHTPGSASLLKEQYFSAFFTGGYDARYLATTTLQALILAAVILSVPAVGRRFGWGYAAFTLCLALLPSVAVSTFMGVGRYLLPAVPAFALLGEWLSKRPGLRGAWIAASGGLMLLMAFGFARSWYLA